MQEVSTILNLSEDKRTTAVIGVVSADEKTVFWSGVSMMDGHLVMRMDLSAGSLDEAELVTGGPTMIGHMAISDDEQHLLLADMDMGMIERVRISDGEVTFVTKYGDESFRPGKFKIFLS